MKTVVHRKQTFPNTVPNTVARRNYRQIIMLIVTSVACFIVAAWGIPAMADTAGEIGEHVATQGQGIGNAISVAFYALGMVAGGGAFMKLKANRDNPQQHPMSQAAILAVACAGLLFLPETFQSAGDTIYNKDAKKNVISGNTNIGG